MAGSRSLTSGTSSASRRTFLPSPARRTFENMLMGDPLYCRRLSRSTGRRRIRPGPDDPPAVRGRP